MLAVREMPRRKGRLWGWAAQGRKGLTGQGCDAEEVGEGSCLGAKASWGWATDKGAACREVTRGCLRVLIYNASDINTYVHIIGWTTVLLSFPSTGASCLPTSVREHSAL